MTQQETPDPLGFLLSDPTPRSTPETGSTAHPAESADRESSQPVVGAFPTRRELRMRREAEERAAAETADAQESSDDATAEIAEGVSDAAPTVAMVPAPVVSPTVASASVSDRAPIVPLAPVHVIAKSMAEPEALAPRRSRSSKRRPGGRRVDSARSRTIRQRITGTATMVVVGGIFASLTLPAYAFSGVTTGATKTVTDTSTQNLSVETDAAPAAARDAYSATSASDLRALYLAQTRKVNGNVYARSTAQSMGDDYPWFDMLSRGQGGGLSPLRYYYRECVDFVAWRLNRDAGFTAAPFKWDWSTLTPGGGNASQWKAAWQNHGWGTGTTPVAGAVAWFPANHVAYVKSVLPDGSVLLEEYNYDNDHQYDQRIVAASSVPLYLYAPPR